MQLDRDGLGRGRDRSSRRNRRAFKINGFAFTRLHIAYTFTSMITSRVRERIRIPSRTTNVEVILDVPASARFPVAAASRRILLSGATLVND